MAAVMSVMRSRRSDGIFLVYDLGGGTLDLAVAQSSRGKLNLLSQGGIAVCEGRDFDRRIFDGVVLPWLMKRFDLPDGFASLPEYRSLRRMAEHALEMAKVALSGQEEAIISAQEEDVRSRDRSGVEVYLDLPLTRGQVDVLIEDKVMDSVAAAREAVDKTGISVHDIERVVFVGGPTQYPTLRSRVAFELGVAGSTDVDPMTAVAAGAAIYAEAVDWSSEGRVRKSSHGAMIAGSALDLKLAFVARTSNARAKVAIKLASAPPYGTAFQVDSLDTGWTSGRAALKGDATFDVPLSREGENVFKVFVYDPAGGLVALAKDRFTITKTAATVDAIPASHSIGIEVLEGSDGHVALDWLVRAGDSLPKRGLRTYGAGQSLSAGSSDSLKFKVWEGEIEDPVSDNRFVGMFQIEGTDFAEGMIPPGAELKVRFEVRDSGVMEVDVDVPSVGSSFSRRNFYSRAAGARDLGQEAARVQGDAAGVLKRIDEVAERVSDDRLDRARERVSHATATGVAASDAETVNEALQDFLLAKRLLADNRREHLSETRRIDLERATSDFNRNVRRFATPAQVGAFERLAASAMNDVFDKKRRFEVALRDMRSMFFGILVRQDFFVVDRFNLFADEWSHFFVEKERYDEAIEQGRRMLASNEVAGLRQVMTWLEANCTFPPSFEQSLVSANVVAS